ncbi:hypothetical protein EGW08_011980 [Elysia chlorotica]|uniref:C-type lectin domain-containing protein n=1 Tax=Elysia chlorotica TaxID=188477 RepID=A0A3S1BGG7_ELYCH|nr:hypothetical protein EGW08_011980 [Elysia chlorotica]
MAGVSHMVHSIDYIALTLDAKQPTELNSKDPSHKKKKSRLRPFSFPPTLQPLRLCPFSLFNLLFYATFPIPTVSSQAFFLSNIPVLSSPGSSKRIDCAPFSLATLGTPTVPPASDSDPSQACPTDFELIPSPRMCLHHTLQGMHLVGAVAQGDPSQACPAGYELIPSPRMCLHHSHQAMRLEEARGYCQHTGADLAILRTAEVAQAIHNFLLRQFEVFYWVSLNDRQTEGYWVWKVPDTDLANANLPLNVPRPSIGGKAFYNFRSGQPTKHNARRERDHDCSVMDSLTGKMVETHCALAHPVLCQTRASNHSALRIGARQGHTTGAACMSDWTMIKTRNTGCTPGPSGGTSNAGTQGPGCEVFYCIKAFWEELTWLEALEHCGQHNGELLTVETQQKFQVVDDGLSEVAQEVEYHLPKQTFVQGRPVLVMMMNYDDDDDDDDDG